MNDIEKKQQEMASLHKRHHEEFVKLFSELKQLMKDLALSCDHNFEYISGEMVCSNCGITKEYYRGRSWQR
jgi:rubrerythrin